MSARTLLILTIAPLILAINTEPSSTDYSQKHQSEFPPTSTFEHEIVEVNDPDEAVVDNDQSKEIIDKIGAKFEFNPNEAKDYVENNKDIDVKFLEASQSDPLIGETLNKNLYYIEDVIETGDNTEENADRDEVTVDEYQFYEPNDYDPIKFDYTTESKEVSPRTKPVTKPQISPDKNSSIEQSIPNDKNTKESFKSKNADDETVVSPQDQVDDINRSKRSANPPTKERVTTADTILNIRGSVRASIADSPVPMPLRSQDSPQTASEHTLLDTFVIHPSKYIPPAHRSTASPHSYQESEVKGDGTGEEDQVIVAPGGVARLVCPLPSPLAPFTWYKDDERIQLIPGSSAWSLGSDEGEIAVRGDRQLAGPWRCTGSQPSRYSPPINLVIYEEVGAPWLELEGRRLDGGARWVPATEGQALRVRCVSERGAPAPKLTLALVPAPGAAAATGAAAPAPDIQPLAPNDTDAGANLAAGGLIWITRHAHGSRLLCSSEQRRPGQPAHTKTSAVDIHVTYPPSFVISRVPGFGVALVEGAAAALRCDVDSNPAARARWHRDPPAPPAPTPAADYNGEGRSAVLRWRRLAPHHAGWYRCRATYNNHEYSSIGYFLHVRPNEEGDDDKQKDREKENEAVAEEEEKKKESDDGVELEKVVVPLGAPTSLHCPKGTVGCWSRLETSEGSWQTAGTWRAHGVLQLGKALHVHAGEYRCVGVSANTPHSRTLETLKRVSLAVQGPPTATALETQILDPPGLMRRATCLVCAPEGSLVSDLNVFWVVPGLGEIGKGDILRETRGEGKQCGISSVSARSHLELWCIVTCPPHPSPAIAGFPAARAPPPPRALASSSSRKSLSFIKICVCLMVLYYQI